MLPKERRSQIQDLIALRSRVTISELAELFVASEMTIRRDLDYLESRGVCQRIHGGAVSLRVIGQSPPPYPLYEQREQHQAAEKAAIARAAAGLVRPGEVVALDSGTTATYLARALRATSPLTVISNSIRVLDPLHDVSNITLICPGGTLFAEDMQLIGSDYVFVGPLAVSTLRRFRPNKVFIGTSGITVNDGISNAGLFQAEIKRTLIEIAEEAILIADHTKFGQVSGFLVAGVRAFRRIITDTLAPAAEVEALRAQGIEVSLVEPAEDVEPLPPAILSAATSAPMQYVPGL
jgi:DeoR/GlpR family transcriptional regulator of sugar metabolism